MLKALKAKVLTYIKLRIGVNVDPLIYIPLFPLTGGGGYGGGYGMGGYGGKIRLLVVRLHLKSIKRIIKRTCEFIA